jgi:hypothetical protein
MVYFFNGFTLVAGILAALVLFRILPLLAVAGVRLLTTKKWQARKYRTLMQQGNVGAAQWGRRMGFATEE